MSYSFDLDNIKNEEIVNILENLKNKKKYYRLKSGDIINLEEDSKLQEFADLSEELDLNNKDISSGNIILPKYRAIYLDSLRNSKYNFIETNNLFDELINKFNHYKDCSISLTSKDKNLLRPYQVEGVKWLYNIDKSGFGGILADEMGLGKSIQTIYYIKELLKENKDYKFLIISPTSLAYNWKNEFDKFAPKLKYKVFTGNRNSRRDSLNEIDNINILITTYGLVREDKEIYDNINFKTIIIDEAQNIKNVNTNITKTVKSLKAEARFALTGTPIENSILELWSIFDFIMPGLLIDLNTFDKKYKVRDFDDDGNDKIERLKKIISPFILRRKKIDVIKDLPEKLENNIYIDLTKEQKKIYLAELEKVNKEMDNIIKTEGISKARFLILKLLTRLRQICIDPRIVFDGYTGSSGKMEEFINVVREKVEDNHKILVFTSFKQALILAKKELDNNGISSYVIDGSVSSKKRIELVDKFNSDNTNVFFIMLKAGGTGLNLTSADVVIHLDLWWNPQAENQATDRAHRIGQKNVVDVIKFISRGTIEEKILELQKKKKILSDKLIDSNEVDNAFNKLTEKDIKELLSYDND
jgi:SNF2 family DNA or RNA helicase